jgi:hypothetical protein
MTRLFPNEKLQLPPKRLLGNNFDPEFIESRRSALHAYIQKILLSPHLRNRCVAVAHCTATHVVVTGGADAAPAAAAAATQSKSFL